MVLLIASRRLGYDARVVLIEVVEPRPGLHREGRAADTPATQSQVIDRGKVLPVRDLANDVDGPVVRGVADVDRGV